MQLFSCTGCQGLSGAGLVAITALTSLTSFKLQHSQRLDKPHIMVSTWAHIIVSIWAPHCMPLHVIDGFVVRVPIPPPLFDGP